MFDSGQNFPTNVNNYASVLIDDLMGQGTKEFYDIIWGDDGRKLDLAMLKANIAEMAEVQDSDYVAGVKKVYLIHPPQLEDELRYHLSTLLLPAMPDSVSARLISVTVGEKTCHFVVEPYKMDLPRRHSSDSRWLIVHLYNPDKPALAIRVEAQGPWTFKEPTPLLSDTEVAETWAMEVLQAHLRDTGVDVQDVCYEPNGPKTFPDYLARLDGTAWNFEITRVLGDILETRHILDKPKDERKMMERAVQSPPIEDSDVRVALNHAIKSKEQKRQSDGTAQNLCLVLLNPLDLDIGSQSAVWEGMDLSAFDAVVLINGYSQPRIDFLKGTPC